MAIGAAIFAVLISIGSAMRIHRIEGMYGEAAGRQVGLTPGSPVPIEALAAVAGNGHLSNDATGRSLLVFVTQGCQPCRHLIEGLNKPRAVPPGVQLLIVEPSVPSGESLRDLATFTAEWIVDDTGDLRQAFKTGGTPHSFLIRDGHVLAQALGTNIRPLLEAAAQQTAAS